MPSGKNNKLDRTYHDPDFYDYLFSAVFNSSEEEILIKDLEGQTDVYLFGGITRDHLFSSFTKHSLDETEDIDIVVTELNIDTIQKYIVKRTKFGGYKLKINGSLYDIWELKDTWNYNKIDKKINSDLVKLSKLVFFSFNTSIYWINKRLWYISREFGKSVRNEVLDIVFGQNPYPELSIIRAYKYFKKYNYILSPRMKNYLKSNFDPVELENYQKDRYGSIRYNINDLYKYIMTNNYIQKDNVKSNQLNILDTY